MYDGKSICEICHAEIDLNEDGWMETDTGDACAECVESAKGHEEV